MAKNRLLLASVAFGTSFCLSLLMSRDIKTASLTGLITVPATFLGLAAVNYRQRNQQKLVLTALESQIYHLERQETHLNQSWLAIATEKQRAEVNLNFLQTESRQLRTQIAEQRRYKQQLGQDLIALEGHKSHLEADLHDLQHQICNCEQRRGELYEYLRTTKLKKQNLETEFEHLHTQIAKRESQKQEIETDLAVIEQAKPRLEEEMRLLQIQTQELEKQNIEMNHFLSKLSHEKNIAKSDLNLIQLQLSQLQSQTLEQQIIKDKLEQEVTTITEGKLQLKTQQVESPDEWTKFGMKLSRSELLVLKVIVEENEPILAIRKIAEEDITMPELIIDSINEHALDTIGDLIVDPGNGSFPPKVSQEYLMNVNKLLKINDTN